MTRDASDRDLLAHAPNDTVLCGPWGAMSRSGLESAVNALAESMTRDGVRVLATLLDNGPAAVCIDLAALRAGIAHVPLAGFQTPLQWQHILDSSGADALVFGDGDTALAGLFAGWRSGRLECAGQHLILARREIESKVPAGTAKVSYTSGSTGAPKGVCLERETMLRVARGVAEALAPLGIRRHQALLPLPVLLENIAGLYAPLLAGAMIDVRPCASLGLRGAAGFDPAPLQRAVTGNDTHSVILLPQMLRAWTGWLRANGCPAPPSLRFVAVGGAPVGAPNLERARAAGLPAYEGYGLTEGASVQTLNLPGADRPGSVGRVLPHCRVRIATSGEIEIADAVSDTLLGGAAGTAGQWHPTGDLGRLDEDGFVWIDGRRRNVFITGFGRNVSPEWVEASLESEPAIARAVVYGEALDSPVAVLWPAARDLGIEALGRAVREANLRLPDYARVGRWMVSSRPFDADSGMATPNGRPRRDAIASAHGVLLRRTPIDNPDIHEAAP
jgi:long-subunit acyl-CoA synthetase (AMP-forming)